MDRKSLPPPTWIVPPSPVAVLGGAVGAKAVGESYRRAALGSLAGLGLATGVSVAIWGVDADSAVPALLFPVLHAALLTIMAVGD